MPVQINLRSRDVIHSFWVPKLAGKMDTIPGVTNMLRIEADQPGDYRGQCTEFCGLQHAKMAFFVVALQPDEFKAWWDRQLQDAAVDAGNQGQQVFLSRAPPATRSGHCPPAAFSGPNLSHFAAAKTIAAGALPNNAENLSLLDQPHADDQAGLQDARARLAGRSGRRRHRLSSKD